MAEPGAHMRLKEWIIAQIDSGRYPGLRWENREKTLFRIPWKHAAKQDYRQQEDAALFKAWAIYKGKYQEGTDKADPSTWKTRLRCALNKSTDFQEVPERSQLDISEPYKVYQIVSEGARDHEKEGSLESSVPEEQQLNQLQAPVPTEMGPVNCKPDKASVSSGLEEDGKKDLMETCQTAPVPLVSHLPSHPAERGYQVKGVFCGWSSTPTRFLQSPPPRDPSPSDVHTEEYNSGRGMEGEPPLRGEQPGIAPSPTQGTGSSLARRQRDQAPIGVIGIFDIDFSEARMSPAGGVLEPGSPGRRWLKVPPAVWGLRFCWDLPV